VKEFTVEESIQRSEMERREEWREWVDRIPYLKFHAAWEVRPIPPFSGAVARFQVKQGEAVVSVYLDCYEKLGFFGGEPYWELYPYDDDVHRVGINESDALISAIAYSIEQQNKGET
jgi:hypothetical protein